MDLTFTQVNYDIDTPVLYHEQMDSCLSIIIQSGSSSNILVYVCLSVFLSVCINRYTHIHTDIHIHTYIHTNTHTYTLQLNNER